MSAIEGELIHNHYLSPSTESYNGIKKSTDFIGFTFGGKHSSELGINRVSNGSRYTETLLPEFSNKTVNVPGANRVDYLGVEFTQKSFPLDIAFDSVTEEQLREMKRLFSTDKPLPLVFDESPYKTYYAKAGGNPSFSYICFDEEVEEIEKKVKVDYSKQENDHTIDYFSNEKDLFQVGQEIEVEFSCTSAFSGHHYFIETSIVDETKGITYTKGEQLYVILNFLDGSIQLKEEGIFFPSFTDISLEIRIEEKKSFNKRIYKGEGKIDLVSFYPYAFTDRWFLVDPNNYLSDENDNKKYKYNNVDEWYKSSGLPTRYTNDNVSYINFSNTTGLEAIKEIQWNEIYNPGDFDTTFSFIVDINNAPKSIEIEKAESEGEITIRTTIASLFFYPFSQMGEDTHIGFNGNNQLIEGYKKVEEKYIKTGNIYNQYIQKGNWFVFPKGMGVDEENVWYYFKITNQKDENISNEDTIVDYKILYL